MSAPYKQPPVIERVGATTSQFVGRQKELALIWNQYKVAMAGSARVILLVGEQGIGKSRLLDEIALRTIQNGATVLRGGASESEGMPPYLPFLEALGKRIQETPVDQLREQVEGVPQLLISILPELAIHLGENPALYSLPPEQMRLRLYEAVGIFLNKISTPHGLVLTLDDLQWADSASLDLLCHLVRSQSKAGLLVLGTYREGEIEQNPALHRTIAKLDQQRALTRIVVEPLSAEEIEALAVSFLGGPISPVVSHLLFTQSEGNPFFAEELLHSWIEKGEIAWENEQWMATAPLEHALPQSIVGILRQRFMLLSSDIINHLRVASIIGRSFDLSLLAAVESQEVEVLEEQLLEAALAGLIHTEQAGVFTFSHDKIRECLYAEVSTSRRRRLHEAIGHVLEAQYNQEKTKSMYHLAELAFHFTQSGDRERGVTYAQQAAQQALQSSAFKEAVTHYHLALELLPLADERRCSLLTGLGEAALLANAESEAANAYKEALVLFKRSGERQAAAQAAHGLALAQWQQESLKEARATLEHALALSGDNQSAEMVRILVDLATLLTNHMDNQVEGMTYAQRALEIAYRLGDNSLEAAASRAVAGKVYAAGTDLTSTSHSLERAVELAEAGDASAEAAESCFYLARAYYWMAEIRRSYVMSFRMMDFIEQSQNPSQLRNALPWLALLHSSEGEWAEAEQAIVQAQPIVEHLTSSFPSAFLHLVRGFLDFQQEDYEGAEREFQAANVSQQVGPERLMFFTGLPGLTHLALGKRKEAEAYSVKLEFLLSELPTGALPTAPIMTCLALMAIAMGKHKQAANLYPILQTFRGQHHWFLVDRVLGQLATLLKDWDAAMLYLTKAKETAQRERLRPELARTLLAFADLEMARRDQKSGTQAAEFLNQALALFQQLNMPTAIAQTQNQLLALSQKSLALPLLPADLTKGEAKVLQLVAMGKSNRQIGQYLGISEKTVANRLTNIFIKTASENRAAAAAFAIRHKLV